MSKVRQLKSGLVGFVKQTKGDTNIDFKSICDLIPEEKEEILFNIICDVIFFETHNFITYKQDKQKHSFNFNIEVSDKYAALLAENKIKNKYVNYARDLQDFLTNIVTSDFYGEKIANDAEKIAKDAEKIVDLKVTVLKNKELKDLDMNLVLAVNQGSNHEVNVVVLEYNNNPEGEKIVIIGKEICFDTGGYDLKSTMFIEGMKFDMTRAALVMSVAMALAKTKSKINFVAVGLLTDNRIGKNTILSESIVKSKNRLTVEINNTDAKGRLDLADGMTYTIREKGVDKIYDISTLTGATAMALGESA